MKRVICGGEQVDVSQGEQKEKHPNLDHVVEACFLTCVLPILGRPLPGPVPVLGSTLLMFGQLQIFQFIQSVDYDTTDKVYGNCLGDRIPILSHAEL